jgi:hypothetical protein
MTSKRCPNCKEKTKWAALTCKYCGDQPPQPIGNEPMSWTKNRHLIVLGILALFLVLVHDGPKDPKIVAMRKCDEKVYFSAAGSAPELSSKERMKCAEPMLIADRG